MPQRYNKVFLYIFLTDINISYYDIRNCNWSTFRDRLAVNYSVDKPVTLMMKEDILVYSEQKKDSKLNFNSFYIAVKQQFVI